MNNSVRIRPSVRTLQKQYEAGNKKPLEDLMRAWKGIKALHPDDPKSFFQLGGFHGEPFRGAGWGNSSFWGGYCNHGNVLFPTWHRAYLKKLEEALQSIEGCDEVMLPFWDETSEETLQNGIPWPLTADTFELDGETIPNPLKSFVFPRNIVDHINGDTPNYSKPLGYETVRYPLSGLVGTEAERAATAKHNAQFPDHGERVKLLNTNVMNWLNTGITIDGKYTPTNVHKKFKDCLNAPNFTVFSNTTSASEWNSHLSENDTPVVPLESPHNSIHLAVGGYDVPTGNNAGDFSSISGANGDMGENDTAGLDPIFFFHHCNVDRVFWLWQKKHGFTDKLELIPEYPGSNSADSQGPTPGTPQNSWLTMESPLNPFKINDNGVERDYNSNDCVNVETQLGYTYEPGSLEDDTKTMALLKADPVQTKLVRVSGINRAPIRGSFLISAYANIDGKSQHIGTEAVLSRWNTQYCANCQTHLEAQAYFEIPVSDSLKLTKSSEVENNLEVKVHGRDGLLSGEKDNVLLKSDGSPAFKVKVELL